MRNFLVIVLLGLAANLVFVTKVRAACVAPILKTLSTTFECELANGSTNYCETEQECLDKGGAAKVGSEFSTFEMCEVASGQAKTDCEACLTKNGVFTALGCIRFDPAGFATDFMKVALGVSGGIALLLLLYGAFLLSISAGDPKKAQQGQEIISGTIAGLLFIIFSGLLMKLIGIDILDLPGL